MQERHPRRHEYETFERRARFFVPACPDDSAVLVPSTAQSRGAPLRCAPFGVTFTARATIPETGRDEEMAVSTEPRDDLVQTASFIAFVPRAGSNSVPVSSMAHATPSNRSPMVRNARPWEWPRLRNAA